MDAQQNYPLKNAFRFDTNKCVGCMACAVGCSIENQTSAGMNWRVVNSQNLLRHPDLPVFHFSLACNHCDDAPCMKNCPALAYSRDAITGAIIHHAEACIGCKYCTWACPYDAPKFNPATQTVEKCNFCTTRLADGLKPACVQACPVGALEFETEGEVDYSLHLMPGFVNAAIRPSIHLIPLRQKNTKPIISNLDQSQTSVSEMESWLPPVPSKVTLQHEWTLALFTLIAATLVAWLADAVLHGNSLSFTLYLGISVGAIILTSLHIGKKLRMGRFVLNLRGSWLSREIFFFGAFVAMGALFSAVDANLWNLNELVPGLSPALPGWLAFASGTLALISIDMVYKFLHRRDSLPLHSAMVTTTGIMLLGLFSAQIVVFGAIALLKLVLYSVRKTQLYRLKAQTFPFLSLSRILLLLTAVLFQYLAFPIEISLALILAGEAIDRAEFYYESEARSPKEELRKSMI